MNEIRQQELKLCKFQAEIFAASYDSTDCGSKTFIRRFMNSDLAKRFDKASVLFESFTALDALDELDAQYGPSSYGQVKFTPEELYWIGYIYRYWSCLTGQSAKHLYKAVPVDYIRSVYFPYHSLDPQQAIERIAAALDIPLSNGIDDMERCVAIVRKVRMKYA